MKNETKENEYSLIRNYKYWNGYNQFYCDGKIMLGPNGLKLLLITLLLINIPIVLIFIFSILVI